MSDTSTDVWPPPPPSHSWHIKGETLYQQYQGLDSRQSPNKELPTKILKHDRVKDRQDIAQTLNFDRSHTILLTNKRCAGTQTPYSSFELPPDGEVIVITDTYRQQQQQQQQQQQRPMVSPCHPHSTTVPLDMDTENVPLNLSVSNNNNNNNNSSSSNNNNSSNSCLTSSLVSSQQQQLRPSVITCTFTNRYYSNMNSYGQDSSPNRRELTSGMSDPEEHFRRSLGKDYQKLNQQSPVEPLAKQILDPNVSVGSSDAEPDNLCSRRLILLTTQDNCPSVDDHFAKSLGNSTWSAIKAKRDESSESVDDHFAKALGDTWHRIKAEKENNCDTLRSSSPLHQSSGLSS